MKRKVSVLLAVVLSLNISATFAGEDEKAITAVIEEEYKAYLEKDLDSWSNYWVHEPYVHALNIGAMGYDYVISFDSLKVRVEAAMNRNNEGGPGVDKKINKIQVADDMATVFLDEIFTWKFAGEENDIKMKSTYVLKKVEDEWKFVSMTTFNKTSFENNDFTSEWKINFEGYQLMRRDELDKAIKVFELNTQLYPDAFNTWDSLAEAYMEKGDNEKAIKYYKKSLELNPQNENAKEMLEKLENEEN